jgi:AraC-like DNA-binding protein
MRRRENRNLSTRMQQDACRATLMACRELHYAGLDIRVRDVCWHRARPRLRVQPHRHAYYEALLTVSGAAQERTGFHQQIVPGLIQLHAPGRRHGWEGSDAPLERFAFYFSLPSRLALRPLRAWPVLPEAVDALTALVEETRSTRPGRVDRVRAQFILLASRFFDLLDWSPPAHTGPPWEAASLAEMVNRHLEDNLDVPLGLPEIALFAGVSVPTLTRRYRAETGETVIEHLGRLRLERAARLLVETDQTVAVIAARTGFAEPSYFCSRFRKRYRCTPSVYRKRLTRR